MRYLIGIIVTFFVVVTALYFSLQIWQINLFDAQYLKDAWIIFAIAVAVSFILAIILPFFFKPHSFQYDEKNGTVAQPKK